MLLLALTACGCPSFEETDVVDTTGTAPAEDVDWVRQAVDAFAAWTGDAGVCVPRVEMIEEVYAYPVDAPDEMVVGEYDGGDHVVRVEAGTPDLWSITHHELCHALDDVEEHSDAVPWIFPETSVADDYPEEMRVSENFANYCEEGPRDVGLRRALDAACGTVTVSLAAAYVADVVFPAAEGAEVVEERVPVAATTRFLPLRDVFVLYDVAGSPDGIVLLAQAFDGARVVRLVDPDDGAVRAEVPVADAASLLPADEGVLVLRTTDADDGETVWHLAHVDFDAGTVRPLDVPLPDYPGWMTLSGGVVYVGRYWDGVQTLRAWTLDGDEVPVGLPQEDWGRNVEPDALWPEEGGVGMLSGEGVSRWDRAADAWTLAPAPPDVHYHARLPDGRDLFLAWGGDVSLPVVHDPGEDTWALTTLPCPDLSTAWGVGNHLLQAGDRVFAWSAVTYTPEGELALVLTELTFP